MKLHIHLASATAGLAILAANLPGVALAAPSAITDGTAVTKDTPVVQTSAKVTTKVQGWSTDGEMSDEDCQGFADQIQDAIDHGLEDIDSNDIEGALASMDLVDSLDSLAGEMGCAISYPSKTKAPDKSDGMAAATVAGTSLKAEGWQTGEGDMSDADCQAYADRVTEYLDQAGANFDSGDAAQAFYDLDLADMYEDAALDGGCAIKY